MNHDWLASLVARVPQFDPAIVDRFLSANAQPKALDVRFLRSLGATITTRQAMERLFRQKPTNPWAGFDKRYPKATG
jgi:hypothetical protein